MSSLRGQGSFDYKNDNFQEHPQGSHKPREREISTTSDRVFTSVSDPNEFSPRSNGSEFNNNRSWSTRDSSYTRNIDNIRNADRQTDSDTSGTLTRPNGRIPHTRQNGYISNSRLPLNKSLSLSKRSLNLSRTTLYGRDYGVQKSLFSLGLLAILSLVLVILSVQLLFKLHSRQESGSYNNRTMLSQAMYRDVVEVAVVLSTFVIMLDVCCLLVCSMQCFLTAKILKVPQGEERAFKYLKECANTRFVSIIGFFFSIPAFLLVIVLFVLMELKFTSAIVALVILGLGMVYCIVAIIHSTYYWRVEKNRANSGAPVWDPDKSGTNELSTLV